MEWIRILTYGVQCLAPGVSIHCITWRDIICGAHGGSFTIAGSRYGRSQEEGALSHEDITEVT